MPTPTVVATVGQVLTLLPQGEREIGRIRFSEALRGIVAQQLVPRADGAGRTAVVEVLVATQPVREAVRDPARLTDLPGLMAAGDAEMTTFTKYAQTLVQDGAITKETAKVVQGEAATSAPTGRSRRRGD
jgi:twitching motility protein PilT